MTEALDRSTLWLQEKTCSAIAEAATSPFFRVRASNGQKMYEPFLALSKTPP